ncbi:MAG: lysozyme [Caulobacteraceae bacterium]|nr:lysozyme [Caulobacter sp.]
MTDPKLEALLRRHEGVRLRPYRDSVGKLTIGVGRNLDDVGITPDEATVLLRNDIDRTGAGLDAALPWWSSLEPARRRVLMDMAFNLGVPGLLAFKLTLAAVRDGCFAEAADRMLQSRWATQVGERAKEMAAAMRTGVDAKAPRA